MQTNTSDGPGRQEQSLSGIRNKRLTIWIVAGVLLALWAYSYWGMGPVQSDVQVQKRLPSEETRIQTLLAQEGDRPEVNVFQVQEGRQVEIILTNDAVDSLALMDISSPPKVATNRARDIARTLKTSYEAFATIHTLEVGFAKRLTVKGMGVGRSTRLILDENDLQALTP